MSAKRGREFDPYLSALESLALVDTLSLQASQATEMAAIAAADTAGYGDKKTSDQKAVEVMRSFLNKLSIRGTVVVGEGEKDEAPMLYIGEVVGNGQGIELDIAVDPLEGTDATADLKERASSVLAITEKGGLLPLHHSIHYMDKLIVGPEAKGKVDIDAPVEENIEAIAKALDREPTDINVVVLRRDRNLELIASIRKTGARVKAIEYGDLIPGVLTAIRGSGVHAVMGIGGAPEGVLSAAGIKGLGGEVQTRVWAGNEEKKQRLLDAGVDLDRVYTEQELVPGKFIVFSATAVTNNERVLEGVRFFGEGARTNTLQICSVDGKVRITTKDSTLVVDNTKGFQYKLR